MVSQTGVELFSFQGHMYTSVRDTVTGKPQQLKWLGNVQDGKIAFSPTISDKYESFSGNRLLYGRLMKEKKGTLTLTCDEMLWETLTLATYATGVTAVSGTTVTNEQADPATGIAANDMVATAFPLISALTVHDNAAATLVAGTDYNIISANRGIIQFLSTVGTFTQPFKFNYTYGAYQNFPMFTSVAPLERYIVFDGVNTMDGEAFLVDLFRVQFLPAKEIGLIDPDYGTFELEGAVLYDSLNAANANFGGFGLIRAN